MTEFTTAILNTLAISFACIAVAVPVGAALSILLVRTNVWGRQLAWVAVGSQLAVPLYVFAGGWSAGFGMQGWTGVQDWLVRLGGPVELSALQSGAGAMLAVAVIHALASIPWVCLIISLGLVWMNRSQEESALLEGGWWYLLTRSALPKLKIWLLASCLWCLLPIMTEMVIANLYQVPTVAEQVYLDASRGSVSPITYLAAVTICMLPLTICGIVVLRTGPPWREVAAGARYHRARPIDLGRSRLPLSLAVWATISILVALPIFNLVTKAGWVPYVDAAGATHYGWSVSRLGTTVYESLSLFHAEFYWTCLLAITSSATALSIAFLLWNISRRPGIRTLISMLMLMLVAVPGPLAGMLIIYVFNRSSPAWLGMLYDSTLAAPILAQQFRLLPLAWLLFGTIVLSVSQKSWEQAAMDGMTTLGTLRYIVLPQTLSLWIAAALLLAVTSMGELSCSILVLPPGVTTTSMRLFEMLHFGMRHQDSGLCGMLVLLGWFVSFAFWKTRSDR